MTDLSDQSPGGFATTPNGARSTPQSAALEIDIVDVGGQAAMRVPFRPELVGDPADGGLATGVITTLLDQCCGMSVSVYYQKRAEVDRREMRMGGMATLDFRIDFLRPARPGRAVIGTAVCEHVNGDVAVTRAVAFEDSAEDPIALVQAAFMISSQTVSA
jgi:acyl-coenzyme A thioesterase PaaI-like protein